MTTVEILLPYATPPSESVTFALARAKDVYGIRRLSFDRAARTLRIEYDATRLNAAAVTKLVREAGLELTPEIARALLPVRPPAPLPAPAA
jgi:hypothetical protein